MRRWLRLLKRVRRSREFRNGPLDSSQRLPLLSPTLSAPAFSPALAFNWWTFSRASRCSCFGSLADSLRFAARFVTANSAPPCRALEVNTIFYRRFITRRPDSWRDSFPLRLDSLRRSPPPQWRSVNIFSECSALACRCFYYSSLFGR